MRKTIRETADFERLYIEAHISSAVAIGLEYGFDVEIRRYQYQTRTDIRFKQYYISAPIVMAAVDMSFYHDGSIEVEYVVFRRETEKYERSEKKTFSDYNTDALEWIMNLVWNTEGL